MVCSFQGTSKPKIFSGDGDGEIRTLDPLLARQVLSQLSYTPGVVTPHLASLDEVYFFTKIQASLRSLSSSEKCIGIHLLSHTVSSIVPSAD